MREQSLARERDCFVAYSSFAMTARMGKQFRRECMHLPKLYCSDSEILRPFPCRAKVLSASPLMRYSNHSS